MPNLIASAVRQGLYTHVVGRRILYYRELTSTMDEASRLAEEGADEGAVVIAEIQSAGRGRQGRSWISRPGNLLLSVLFRPEMEQLPFISMIGGLAVVRAVRKTTGLSPAIKWPNDVLLGGKKAAGILAESAIVGDSVCYAVLGLGINVALDPSKAEEISAIATSVDAGHHPEPAAGHHPEPAAGHHPEPVANLHPELVEGATSVDAAAGAPVDRQSLLRQLLMDLDDLYLRLQRKESPLPEWAALLETVGRPVTASFAGETRSGVAEAVDEAGNLLLRQDDGQLITLTAGDVTLSGN